MNSEYHFPTLGLIGGGQLARMLLPAARRLGIRVVVLDSADDAPAASGADLFLNGGLYDETSLRRLASKSDVLSYEIEHTDTRILSALEAEGALIRPSPALLACIQDKAEQKRVLDRAGIPVPRFVELLEGSTAEANRCADTVDEAGFAYPCVWKARFGGYDGRGVRVLRSIADCAEVPVDSPGMLEEAVELRAELAVLSARGVDGRLLSYPPLLMRFHDHSNVLDLVEMPAELEPDVLQQARELAEAAVRALGGVGLFAVELFLSHNGTLLVNEIAPRPHNSGHLTIEACYTDQFEQHLRSVFGLPLGSTHQVCPAVMANLIGADGADGRPYLTGMAEVMSIPGVKLHWYGKTTVRPGRKMGHITALGTSLDEARDHCRAAMRALRVVAYPDGVTQAQGGDL